MNDILAKDLSDFALSDYIRKAYSVGPLIYMPGLREDIAEKLADFGEYPHLSAALCLEDTVRDDMVEEAEKNIAAQLKRLKRSAGERRLPMVFIRVREPRQVPQMTELLGEGAELVSGFIIPKIDDVVFADYMEVIRGTDKYFMPIIENPSLVNVCGRAEKLGALYGQMLSVKEKILNVRVGGNDFSGSLGLRNRIDQTIYDLYPIMGLLSDIAAVFTKDFVVSAPVWNYFDSGSDGRWLSGMRREMDRDRAMGFVGKTIIHPSQIAPAAEFMKVSREDYEDAVLLVKTRGSELRVVKSSSGGRMCEHAVHMKWAEKILALASIYGVRE